MSKQKTDIKKMAEKIVCKAKSKNLIKPISAAFKDVPANKEIHKGRKDYFISK